MAWDTTETYPRVNTCLYDWCEKPKDECLRCQRVYDLFWKALIDGSEFAYDITESEK